MHNGRSCVDVLKTYVEMLLLACAVYTAATARVIAVVFGGVPALAALVRWSKAQKLFCSGACGPSFHSFEGASEFGEICM